VQALVPHPEYRGIMPSTGYVRPFIIVADFVDYRIADVSAARYQIYKDMQEISSVLRRQSFGRLNIVLDMEDIFFYHSENNRNYYYTYPLWGDIDVEIAKITKSFLTFSDISEIDFSKYDSNKSGFMDGIFVLGQHFYGWAHVGLHYYHDPLGSSFGNIITLDCGMKVGGILSSAFGEYYSPMGDNPFETFFHEIVHMFGLPDMRALRPQYAAIGNIWFPDFHRDFMVWGTQHGYANIFFRYILNWVDPIILTAADPIREIKIYAVEEPGSGGLDKPRAVVFIPEDNGDLPFTEFFILEYRNMPNILWHPGSRGITIWHIDAAVDFNVSVYYPNHGYFTFDVAYKNYQFIMPVPRRGNPLIYRGDFTAEDLFTPGDVFSPFTTPASNLDGDIPTGAFMEVVRFADDYSYVIINAGFLQPLTAEVDFSTIEPTAESVLATITVPVGVTIVNNYGRNYVIFAENGYFDFKLKNEFGLLGYFTVEVDWIYEDISIHDDFAVLDFVIDDEHVNFRVINNVDGIRHLQFFTVEYIIDEYNNEQFIMATLHPIRLDGLNDFYDAEIEIPETKNNVRFMLWERNTMQPIIMPQNGGR